VDTTPATRLLTVCGSLQQASANRWALRAAATVAAAAGVIVDDFAGLADVPAFDVDHADDTIPAVSAWRAAIAGADVVLVAVPEYAGGMAGALKNAFDWLVGTGEMYRRPVAIISAGTSGGAHAREATARTLTWQGAYVVDELGIAAPRTRFADDGSITDAGTGTAIAAVVESLVAASALPPEDLVARATAVVARLGIDAVHVTPALPAA
jgi:NAD(P)H-dependent FMN reductase